MGRLLVLLISLASCSPEVPEPAPKRPSRPPKPVAMPPEKPAPPPEAAPAKPEPLPEVKPAPPEPPRVYRANVELDLGPWREEDPPSDKGHLPAFTLRTMNHAKVDVYVNGDRTSTTSCLWSVCETLRFDPKIPVPDWPPADAKFVGNTQRKDVGSAEVWIAAGPRAAHVQEGEHVLFVNGRIGTTVLRGALRLYVGTPAHPYRYTDYNPAMDMESEAAMRFMRTLWFEPTRQE